MLFVDQVSSLGKGCILLGFQLLLDTQAITVVKSLSFASRDTVFSFFSNVNLIMVTHMFVTSQLENCSVLKPLGNGSNCDTMTAATSKAQGAGCPQRGVLAFRIHLPQVLC